MRELIRGIKEAKAMASPPRGDYVHADKIGAAISGHFGYQNLRAFWPMSNLDESFNAYDISGQGRTATSQNTGSGLYNNKIPYSSYDGTSYHYRNSEEGLRMVTSFTCGVWATINDLPSLGTRYYFIGREGDFSLYVRSDGFVACDLVDSGSTTFTVVTTTALTPGAWYNIVLRCAMSDSLDIILNGNVYSGAAPADLISNSLPIYIGTGNGGVGFLNGGLAWVFIAASAASRLQIKQHFDSAKTSFKVYE